MSVTSEEALKGHNRTRQVTIIVNGEEKPWCDRRISFDEVVELAFGAEPSNPNICYTVTFKNAAGRHKQGVLVEGDNVKVKNETIFNVKRTDKS